MRKENRHGRWLVNQLGAWRRILPGAAAPAGSRARRTARYLLLVPIVALAALLLVTAMSSERPQAQAQSGDATLEADADCQVPPSDLAGTFDADEAGVVLTWLAPAGCTPAGYAVYRRNMSEDGSRMQQLATVGGDTLTYTDTDVEAGESYRYRVRSNDLGPRSDHTTIDVPEAEPEPAPRSDDRVVRLADPVFTNTANAISVPENTASGTGIGSPYTATDTDGDTLTYTLSGTDMSSFSIVSTSGQLQTNAALNYEVDSSYEVTVGVRDSKAADGTTPDMADDATIMVTITVTNVDEPGTVTLPATFTTGTAVTPMLTDLDGTPTSVTWQWARAATAGGTFANISTAHPYTPVAADVGNYLQATATYKDPQSTTVDKTASAKSTSTVAGTNAAPSFPSSETGARTVSENTASGVIFGTAVAATDPDSGDTLTYSLTGTDASSFGIVASDGRLKTSAALNYEVKSSYSVTVNVHDGKDAAGGADTSTIDDTIAVTITVNNLNEPGVVTITGTPLSGGSTLAASVTDPDEGVTNESWRWARADSAGGTFDDISGATDNTAYVLVAADVGKYVRARVTYTDDQGTGKSASAVTGQISASNAAPTFDDGTTATRTLPENSGADVNVVGGTITAADADNDTLTYSLASGGDNASFEIDSSGQIETRPGSPTTSTSSPRRTATPSSSTCATARTPQAMPTPPPTTPSP